MSSLKDACVAHWKMNDVSGMTVVDSSGNGHNGTTQRDCSLLTTDGKVNGALTFNGTSDYVNTNNTFQSVFQSSFSVSSWVKHTEGQEPDKDIFGTVDKSFKGGVNLYTGTGGKINFYYTNGTTYKTIQTDVVLNAGQETWHHFAAVAEQTSSSVVTLSIYFDNILKKTGTITNCQMSYYTNSNALFVGQANYGGIPIPTEYLDAVIDNITIFNRALTTDEITFLYNNGNGTEELTDDGDMIDETWS